MDSTRKSIKIILIPVIAFAIGLAGCNSSTQAPAATPTTQTSSETSTSVAVSDSTSPTATSVAEASTVVEATAGPTEVVSAASCSKLNLNTLTEADLMSTIPGFSSRMVREFLEYRPYASIQQFRQQLGKYIDQAQVAEYEKYVYVPIDPNASDAETLKQIPGVDDKAAAALIAGRPYASSAAFTQALSTQVDAQQLAGANCYLAAK